MKEQNAQKVKAIVRTALRVMGVAVACVFAAFALLLAFLVWDARFVVNEIDRAEFAADGSVLVLEQVGHPAFFNDVDGRIIWERDGQELCRTDISVANDGGPLGSGDWEITQLGEDACTIILRGEEQYPEEIILYPDGTSSVRQLENEPFGFGHSEQNQNNTDGDGTDNSQVDGQQRIKEQQMREEALADLERERRIREGFFAVLADSFADEYAAGAEFEMDLGAKGQWRVVVSDTAQDIDYLEYDRMSENGRCLLYTWIHAEKGTDGTWGPSDAQLQDTFAVEESSGEVVASGKRDWSESGSQEYHDLTGEW